MMDLIFLGMWCARLEYALLISSSLSDNNTGTRRTYHDKKEKGKQCKDPEPAP